MKKLSGIAVLLFAILLQLCSSGLEPLTLAVGAAGLVPVSYTHLTLTFVDDKKAE